MTNKEREHKNALDRLSYKRRMKNNPEYRKRKLSQNDKSTFKPKTYNPIAKYSIYKSSAKKRGYEFNLTKEYFLSLVVDAICHYCRDSEFIGVDRLKNDIGYTIDNTVSCCSQCNYMKKSSSVEDFINKCKKIANYN